MEGVTGRLTVYFDDPFWVGVFERETGGGLEVSRVVFGAEPTEAVLCEFLLTRWNQLRFSRAVPETLSHHADLSPRKMRKTARRETRLVGIGTKAQQALKLQMETGKKAQEEDVRRYSIEQKERLHQLKQQKKKEKHRGH